MVDILEGNNVNFCQLTPTLFLSLGPKLPSTFEHLLLGGEDFPLHKIDFSKTKAKLYNIYGLTEMSVWQSCVQIKKGREAPIFQMGQNLLSQTDICLENGEIVVKSQTRHCYINGELKNEIHTKDLGEEKKGAL